MENKETEKDAVDILLDKIESLEKRLNEKEGKKGNEKNKDDIDKAQKEAELKDKQTIEDKIKEKMKNRGLL